MSHVCNGENLSKVVLTKHEVPRFSSASSYNLYFWALITTRYGNGFYRESQLLLMVKFVGELRLVLTFLFAVECIMSSRIHSHFLPFPVLLIFLIGIDFPVCINQIVYCFSCADYIPMVVWSIVSLNFQIYHLIFSVDV